MAETSTIVYGIIGLLIVGGLGAYILTPDQLDKASTCTTTNITGIFERLSSTNKTGYWTVNGTQKSTVCTGGVWIPTRTWMEMYNISEVTFGVVNQSTSTEDGIDIITIGETIIVDQTKIISIGGTTYNVTYVEKPPRIKCICERIGGCNLQECIVS
jgi:hypothetical protein